MTQTNRPNIVELFVQTSHTLREVMNRLDATRQGIALVVDAERRLIGTITDGDMRRAVLARTDLDRQTVTDLLERKRSSPFPQPMTAPAGQDLNAYLRLLKAHRLQHLPLLDGEGRVVDLMRTDDFVPEEIPSLKAVIMAGGLGTRLRPLTLDLPKTMLPVADRPLMEIIIGQLRQAGIRRVHVTTHHQPHKISEHFGDGQGFGVELAYMTEDRPLGTAGALGLMEQAEDTLLVINGDILTQVDFRAMLAYHREHQADLTVAVRHYDVKIPYGVVECDGPAVRRLSEKPVVGFFVNAGIYLLEPSVLRHIPKGERFDMTELIQRLLDEKRPVVSFPVREYWLDIGEHAEYQQAGQDAREGKVHL